MCFQGWYMSCGFRCFTVEIAEWAICLGMSFKGNIRLWNMLGWAEARLLLMCCRCPSESLWLLGNVQPGIRHRCQVQMCQSHPWSQEPPCQEALASLPYPPRIASICIDIAGIIFCLSVVCSHLGKSINQHHGLPVLDIGSCKKAGRIMKNTQPFPNTRAISFSILHVSTYILYSSFMVRSVETTQIGMLRPWHPLEQVLYVSGVPGTGKTASVLEVLRRLQAARRVRLGKLPGGLPLAMKHGNEHFTSFYQIL